MSYAHSALSASYACRLHSEHLESQSASCIVLFAMQVLSCCVLQLNVHVTNADAKLRSQEDE